MNFERRSVNSFKVFRRYYSSKSFLRNLMLPKKSSSHHFRFQLFSSNRFYRITQTIKYKRELQELILKKEPKNVYFTPIKWLSPLHLRKTTDYMLSSPLFFDVDSKLPCTNGIKKSVQISTRLIDYIESKYERHPSWIIFSGKRGFHIYYWNWDDIPRRYQKAADRTKYFKMTRQKIVKELLNAGIKIDYSVTADPWRILRVPGTLHGETGCIALRIDTPNQFDISMADPQKTMSCIDRRDL